MTAISASLVKELRDRTSAGMMDCKKALEETKGNIEAAIDLLRSKGLSKAAKKAGRATSEGQIALKASADNTVASIVEVKCETDFVSRGDKFQDFAATVGATVFDKKPADHDALMSLLGDDLNSQIATLGENMSLGRFAIFQVKGTGIIGQYVHNNGKVAALVEVNCKNVATAQNAALVDLAKNLAMQITATSPACVDATSIDPTLVEREREVFRQKTLDEGKPANIVEKIVDGRIQKFYQEVCLLNQGYIREDKLTIAALLEQEGKTLDDTLTIARFVRLQLGDDTEE